MDTDQFWAFIDATATASPDDVHRQAALLQDHLTALTVEEILAFDEDYTQASHALYTWEVWRAADIMIGDASDDVFADFRSWVISRGRSAYERVLVSPDEGLAELDLEDEEEVGGAELFGAAVGQAYEARTGVALYDAFPGRPNADFPNHPPTGREIPGKRKERRANSRDSRRSTGLSASSAFRGDPELTTASVPDEALSFSGRLACSARGSAYGNAG